MKPIIVVVGSYRSGTSAIANVLHSLGVSMGETFEDACPSYPRGSFEAKWLVQLCQKWFCEETLTPMSTRDERIAGLCDWRKMRDDNSMTTAIGAKHPLFCLMIDEIVEAWPDVRFIFADRPVEESEKSLAATGWLWVANTKSGFIQRLLDARDAAAKRLATPPLIIGFHEMLDQREDAIDKIIAWLKSEASLNRQAAVAAVDPTLRHYHLP